jgi:glycosyltransferase involved in cell wall biosynthesis
VTGPPTLSVILCTKDRPGELRVVLQCLAGQTRPPDEIVVVDGSGDDRTRRVVEEKSLATPVRYRHVAPARLTRQRNVGLRVASGELLLFVDDDVVLEPDYVEEVEAAFRRDAAGLIGAVQGRVTNYLPPRPTVAARVRGCALALLLRVFLLPRPGSGRFQASMFPTYPHGLTAPRLVDSLHGCAMSFRREVFQDVRFDEALAGPGDLEDADIACRLAPRFRIRYEPRARLRHLLSPVGRDAGLRARWQVLHHAYLLETRGPLTWGRWAAGWWARLGLCVLYAAALDGESLRGGLAGIAAVLRRASPLGPRPAS